MTTKDERSEGDDLRRAQESATIQARRKLTQTMYAFMASVSESGSIPPEGSEEYALLSQRLGLFNREINDLVSLINAMDNSDLQTALYRSVTTIVEAADLLATRTATNEKVKEFEARRAAERAERAAPAQRARRENGRKAAEIVRRLAAARKVGPGRSKRTAEAVAKTIHSQVNTEMLAAGLPKIGVDAIAKRIRTDAKSED